MGGRQGDIILLIHKNCSSDIRIAIDPMGYVLAKNNLGVLSSECAVFEDSFTGIKAATYAFMRVIGISTTLSADYLKDYTYAVVSDFSDTDKLKTLLG